jgi:hemolysin III
MRVSVNGKDGFVPDDAAEKIARLFKIHRQEAANSWTHGVAAVLAVILFVPLVALAAHRGNARHVISFSVFGVALIFLFSASTLMHWRNWHDSTRRIFDFLDYAGIYILIAASYTPFCLVTLHGPVGWWLFGTVWLMALIGTLLSLFLGKRFDPYAVAVYLVMGWLVVIAIKPLAAGLQMGGMALLLGGGLAYTAGVVVLVMNRFYHSHAIWHLFVGLGALLHLLAIIFYVLPDMH